MKTLAFHMHVKTWYSVQLHWMLWEEQRQDNCKCLNSYLLIFCDELSWEAIVFNDVVLDLWNNICNVYIMWTFSETPTKRKCVTFK